MLRFLRSLTLGLIAGAVVGLYLGWGPLPPGGRSSALNQLAQRHQDDYAVMIAAGYAADGDTAGAIGRLGRLGIDDAPRFLRESTERIISGSSRSLPEIRLLVALSRDLGQLTPPMQPFVDLAESAA